MFSMSVNMALHVVAITTSIEGDMLWLQAMEQEQFSLLILTIHHAHNKD